jgi:hypothetical protein
MSAGQDAGGAVSRQAAAGGGCGAPAGGAPLAAATDAGTQAVVQGRVTRNGSPVAAGYARLLDPGGDFVAEVPLGEDGGFRFFAAPGDWTVRVLAPGDVRAERPVTAATGTVTEVEVTV